MTNLTQPFRPYVATDIEFLALIDRLMRGHSDGFGTTWRGRYWWGERDAKNVITIRGEVSRAR